MNDKNYPPEVETVDTTTTQVGDKIQTTSTNAGSILLNLGSLRRDVSILFTDTSLTFSNIKQNGSTGRIGGTAFTIKNSGGAAPKNYRQSILDASPGGLKGRGGAEAVIFAGGKNDATFTGLVTARGPVAIFSGSETDGTTLKEDEVYTSIIESDQSLLFRLNNILTGETARGGQGFLVSNLDNYSPYVTDSYY